MPHTPKYLSWHGERPALSVRRAPGPAAHIPQVSGPILVTEKRLLRQGHTRYLGVSLREQGSTGCAKGCLGIFICISFSTLVF